MKRTKIICTLGPSSRDETTIAQMLENGMDVARLNFSHGTHAYHKKTIAAFRRVRDRMGRAAAVMLDTKGPEIRLGDFKEGGALLNDGAMFTLTTQPVLGDAARASVTYKDLPAQLRVGDRILIDDGKIALAVAQVTGADIVCEVLAGGALSNHKGVNVPNVHLDFPYLSEQDKADLIFGIEQDVDFIAASFVRSKEDVLALRNFLDYHGGENIRIISKIENIEGVEHFDEILQCSNGIMVARGDMGVEIAYEKLPGLQKKFIRKCYQSGKMVITATQMLESMIHNTLPTRAEITDVANAIFDGTSAIMLSGETAAGDHPAQVVKIMANIAEQAERDAFDMNIYRSVQYFNNTGDTTHAICDAACTTANDLHAAAIIAITKSGYTARSVSKFRPYEPIVAPTPSEKTFHQLSLSWGVYPIRALYQTDPNALFAHAVACAKMDGFVKDGDRVVITGGNDGVTDVLKVQTVKTAAE